MKKQKKSYTKTKNVKEKKIKTSEPKKQQYEGIDMKQKMKQKMTGIINHMNKIKSKTLQQSSDIGLNTMKININNNLNILKTGSFNDRDFDAKKEDYKTFYTEKLKEIQKQIQKRQQKKKQQQKRQQQIQNKKRQQQNQLRQKQIQNLKQKQIKNMTEEQKTKMKDFLNKDRTLVEGLGSKLLELYKDEQKKPPFVKQIQEQLKNYKKQKQNLAYIYNVENIQSKPTSSISKQRTLDQDKLNPQDQARLIKTLYDPENREAETIKSLKRATKAASNI